MAAIKGYVLRMLVLPHTNLNAIGATLANIKAWLEDVLGDEVNLHLEPKKEDEEL